MIDREVSDRAVGVVGRDVELARLDRFIREPASGSAVVLIGGAGIGKTTLWETAVRSARDLGIRVLTARPGASEAQPSLGGLIDLCDQLDEGVLAALPAPQRQALEATLLRVESVEPAPRAVIALALLGVVRALTAVGPVLMAVDDLQWMDPPSAAAIAFVARRLDGACVRFLLARRPGRPDALEAVLSRGVLERVRVGPLSLGAVRSLLFERLGLTISRQRMRRIVEATDGNPLFALEVGRSLLDGGGCALDRDLPLPESLEEILGERVAAFAPGVRRLLLAVALSEDPRLDQLAAIVGARALDDAIDAGAVVVDGPRVRAAHPLLAAAAERRSRARQRRELHVALARCATDEPARVMHLALASSGSDGELAGRLAAASDEARRDGARRQAGLLAAQALRLTRPDAPERVDRVLALAERLDEAGELQRMTELLREELASLPAGPPRARAWVLLSESDDVKSREDQDRHLERALTECGADRNLRAFVLAKKAGQAAAAAVSQLDQAEAWAREAVKLADEVMVRRYAQWALAWSLGLAGRALDGLCQQSSAFSDPSAYISASPERAAAKRLLWRGELARARAAFASLLALADERDDLTSYAMLRMHAAEVELRAGNFQAAAGLLQEWAESSDFETQFRPQYPRCRALLEAGLGAVEQARRSAGETIQLAQSAGSRWDELEARRALGIALLVQPAPEQALEALLPVWEHCERERVRDPGVFPVAPELVEALVELDRAGEAQAIAAKLVESAAQLDHPWARASAKRCSALVSLASHGYSEPSAGLLRGAALDLEQLGFRFDSARCLLTLGRAQRRFKQWRGAREILEQTIAAFDALGAEGWAQRARSEAGRVGGRRRSGGGLTPSEQRVTALAAEGLSNKEIAAALYVAVNTVEVHLARAYVKLGVRSRAQLARRMSAGS